MRVPEEITFNESGDLDRREAEWCWKTGLFSVNPDAQSAADYIAEKAKARLAASYQREKESAK